METTDKIDKLNMASEQVRFELDRKQAIRNNVMRFMNSHPLPKAQMKTAGQRQAWYHVFIFQQRTVAVFAVVLLVVLVGAGTAYASQDALPGDALYSIKVNVVEQIKGALVFGAEAKTEAEINRAAQRLQEVDQLAVSGKLTPEAKLEAEVNLKVHLDSAQKRIDSLQQQGHSEAAQTYAAHLEATLSIHDQILTEVASRDSNDDTELAPFQASVGASLKTASRNRAKLDDGRDQPAPDAQAKAKIESATSVIDKVQSEIDAEIKISDSLKAQARARLLIAQRYLKQANASLDAGNNQDALGQANRALLTAQEALVLAHSQGSSKLDLHINLPSHSDGDNNQGSDRFRSRQ